VAYLMIGIWAAGIECFAYRKQASNHSSNLQTKNNYAVPAKTPRMNS